MAPRDRFCCAAQQIRNARRQPGATPRRAPGLGGAIARRQKLPRRLRTTFIVPDAVAARPIENGWSAYIRDLQPHLQWPRCSQPRPTSPLLPAAVPATATDIATSAGRSARNRDRHRYLHQPQCLQPRPTSPPPPAAVPATATDIATSAGRSARNRDRQTRILSLMRRKRPPRSRRRAWWTEFVEFR